MLTEVNTKRNCGEETARLPPRRYVEAPPVTDIDGLILGTKE